MHTKDKLAQALRDIGLDKLADKAATGYWHDYLSPINFPTTDIVGRLVRLHRPDATKLAEAIMNGEFDASKDEADAWANSREGKAVAATVKRMMARGKKGAH